MLARGARKPAPALGILSPPPRPTPRACPAAPDPTRQKRPQRLLRIAIAVAVAIAAAIGIKLWLFPAKAAASYVTAPVTVADIEDTVIATGELDLTAAH